MILFEEETRATKSAGPDTARKKSPGKYGWVHNFGFCQVNYAKHLEMTFFPLAISFWELANYNKWQTKNDKLLEMLSFIRVSIGIWRFSSLERKPQVG